MHTGYFFINPSLSGKSLLFNKRYPFIRMKVWLSPPRPSPALIYYNQIM